MCQYEAIFLLLSLLMNLGPGFLFCGTLNLTFRKDSLRVASLKSLLAPIETNIWCIFSVLQKQSKDRFGLEGDEESTMLEESVSPKKYVNWLKCCRKTIYFHREKSKMNPYCSFHMIPAVLYCVMVQYKLTSIIAAPKVITYYSSKTKYKTVLFQFPSHHALDASSHIHSPGPNFTT